MAVYQIRGGSRGSQISHATNVKKKHTEKIGPSSYVFQLRNQIIKILSHSRIQTSISFCTLSQRLISQTVSQISGIQMRIDYSAF